MGRYRTACHLRRIVSAHLRLWGMAALADAAELAVSELMANVIHHVPDGRCTVAVLRQDSGVRLEVTDGSPELPEPRTAGVWDESGRGLALLGLIADAWDAKPTEDGRGKTVWCELSVPAEPWG